MNGVNSHFYNLLFVVHVIAIVGLFGPALLFSRLTRKASELRGEAGASVMKVALFANGPLALGSLIALVLAGIGMVIVSDGAWGFDAAWISASFAIAFALFGIGAFWLQSAIKNFAELLTNNGNDEEVRKSRAQIAMSTGFIHIALVIALVLMVWKPGA